MAKQLAKFQRQNFWEDDTIYFLTDSTFIHYPYFSKDEQKEIILDQLRNIKQKFNIKISDFSIAINHYHVKFYLENGLDMLKIKQQLRGCISYQYRKRYQVPYKEMWQSRRIIPVVSEEVNWKISGYIAGNLLKHKEVGTFEKLKNNRFSSYSFMVGKYGENEINSLIRGVIDVNEDGFGNVDIEKLSEIKF